MKPFLEALDAGILLADGGVGTEIYSRGVFINTSYDSLNLSQPDLIQSIHQEFVKAGSQVIETNTFGANRIRLAGFGFETKITEINRRGVELAQEAARNKAYVAGSVGPLGHAIAPIGMISEAQAFDYFAEQISALSEAKPDLLILETFMDISELKIAVGAAKKISKLPIVAEICFHMLENDRFLGPTPEDAVREMETWGVDVIGTNCGHGPQGILNCLERMAKVTKMRLSAMPNAGLPQTVDNRLIYLASPEYMAEYARRFVQKGARLVGGCCGVTPAMIREMRGFIKSISPSSERVKMEVSEASRAQEIKPVATEKKSGFAAKLGKKFAVSVELDPPRGLDPKKAIEGARFLYDHGIDVVNIADGPRAMARMGPMALATLIKENVGMESVIHYCCRDRNVLAMQMDLIGANALGLKNVLAITGDPPKMGNYPFATPVFDVDAIGLVNFISLLNRGLDLSGKPVGEATSLLVGVGVNPGAVNLDLEVERYKKKVAAGAEFVFTQPVYDPELIETFLKKIKGVKPLPIFIGILPLASLRNAEFLHNEVPGMQIPEATMKRMASAKTKEAQQEEGLTIAKESLAAARRFKEIQGTYVFPPFNRYDRVLDLLDGIL